MKIFRSTFLGLGGSVLGATLLAMPASAVSFSFSFKNVLGGADGGIVTGVIRGLEEGTSEATSVEVLSNAAGYGLGEYVGSPSSNSWTVSGGNLVAFDFLSFVILNTPPAVTNATLFFNSSRITNALFRAGIESSSYGIFVDSSGIRTEDINLTFTRLDDPKSVPEPTSILSLLAFGAAVMGTTLTGKRS